MTNENQKLNYGMVALMKYIDEQLMHLCKTIEPHIEPDAVCLLYEQADAFLADLEDTLAVRQMYQKAEVDAIVARESKKK